MGGVSIGQCHRIVLGKGWSRATSACARWLSSRPERRRLQRRLSARIRASSPTRSLFPIDLSTRWSREPVLQDVSRRLVEAFYYKFRAPKRRVYLFESQRWTEDYLHVTPTASPQNFLSMENHPKFIRTVETDTNETEQNIA